MDDRSFESGSWDIEVRDPGMSLDPWKHHPMTQTGALPYAGRYSTYPGSGYVAKLPKKTSGVVIQTLRNSSWVDNLTRAVLLQMNLYNFQSNLFAAVTISWEFMATGGATPYISIQMPNIRLLTSAYGYVLTLLEIILFAIYVILLVNTFTTICASGVEAFFKSVWNWIQLSIVACGITSIVVYIHREVQSRIILKQLSASSDEYFEMSVIVMWNETYVMLTGCVVFLVCAKLLQLMEFNRVTRLFVAILKESGPALAAFSLMFLVMFLAFAVAGNLLFGRHLYVFSTMVNSLQECGAMVMGRFSFNALITVQPILGGFYFVWFMSSCYMILMNVFMTILNDSIADIGEQDEKDDFSYVAYMLKMLKDSLGIGNGRAKRGAKAPFLKEEENWKNLQTTIRRLVKFVEKRYGRVEYKKKRRVKIENFDTLLIEEACLTRDASFENCERRHSLFSSLGVDFD